MIADRWSYRFVLSDWMKIEAVLRARAMNTNMRVRDFLQQHERQTNPSFRVSWVSEKETRSVSSRRRVGSVSRANFHKGGDGWRETSGNDARHGGEA